MKLLTTTANTLFWDNKKLVYGRLLFEVTILQTESKNLWQIYANEMRKSFIFIVNTNTIRMTLNVAWHE